MDPSNLADTTFADLIPPFPPPTGTSTGSFSVIYPTIIESSTSSDLSWSSTGALSDYPTSTESSTCSGLIPSRPSSSWSTTSLGTRPPDPPPRQSDTSPPSEFVVLVDNPLIVASLILLIISLTILGGVCCRIRQTRRRCRQWQAQQLPPPPDVYMIRPSGSLSIKNVALSSLGSHTPPRAPSPVFSLSAQSIASDFQSSDIHHVQRELRGLSFQPGAATSRPASRSSLGTTKTRRTSPIPVWIGDRPRRHGVLWDIELGRWKQDTEVSRWQPGLRVKALEDARKVCVELTFAPRYGAGGDSMPRSQSIVNLFAGPVPHEKLFSVTRIINTPRAFIRVSPHIMAERAFWMELVEVVWLGSWTQRTSCFAPEPASMYAPVTYSDTIVSYNSKKSILIKGKPGGASKGRRWPCAITDEYISRFGNTPPTEWLSFAQIVSVYGGGQTNWKFKRLLPFTMFMKENKWRLSKPQSLYH
ncbi:hypothetical protein B0H19DRAFT_1058503 [Mycena capillaripes]|nr:hypothetical protein B0H19DRAFT_1058503 [Mycena capillaripes]